MKKQGLCEKIRKLDADEKKHAAEGERLKARRAKLDQAAEEARKKLEAKHAKEIADKKAKDEKELERLGCPPKKPRAPKAPKPAKGKKGS